MLEKIDHSETSAALAERGSKRLLIAVIGPPGSGKTTAAATATRSMTGVVHVSAGDVIREAVATGNRPPRDLHVRGLADPLWTAARIVETAGEALCLVVDGFPRHSSHLAAWDGMGRCIGALHLQVCLETGIDRMRERGRAGEDLAGFALRRHQSDRREADVIDGLRERGIPLIGVDGEQSVSEVADQVAAEFRLLIQRFSGEI